MRAVLTTAEILDERLGEECVAMCEARRDPYPFSERLFRARRHLVRDRFPEGRRTLPDVEDEIDHVTAQGSNELAHVGIPLEVQATDRAWPGPALVGLRKLDALQKRCERARSHVAAAKGLREIASLIAESGEPDDFDFGNGERNDIDDFHVRAPPA